MELLYYYFYQQYRRLRALSRTTAKTRSFIAYLVSKDGSQVAARFSQRRQQPRSESYEYGPPLRPAPIETDRPDWPGQKNNVIQLSSSQRSSCANWSAEMQVRHEAGNERRLAGKLFIRGKLVRVFSAFLRTPAAILPHVCLMCCVGLAR